MAYAKNVPMLLAGRAITGFAGGVASLVVPVSDCYIYEIYVFYNPQHFLITINSLFMSFFVLLDVFDF